MVGRRYCSDELRADRPKFGVVRWRGSVARLACQSLWVGSAADRSFVLLSAQSGCPPSAALVSEVCFQTENELCSGKDAIIEPISTRLSRHKRYD